MAAKAAAVMPAPADVAANNAPPSVTTNDTTPVKQISGDALYQLGLELNRLFTQYAGDRLLQEQKYIRNLRQYLGLYDPEIENALAPNQSRAYPRLTRVKCISMLARIMNLMFPGNEDNWEIQGASSAAMNPNDIQRAVAELLQTYQQNQQQPPPMSQDLLDEAMRRLASERSDALTAVIKDQMNEIGGDQTLDYISLVRQVVFSGIKYGLGVLEGPFVRPETKTQWTQDNQAPGGFSQKPITIYKPQFDFISVWDYYPDMAAKTLSRGDGHFLRKVMGRFDVRKLADRPDFFADQVKKYLKEHPQGNYRPKSFETELRTLGTKANVNETKTQPEGKYEVIIWKGPVSAATLMQVGVDVPEKNQADMMDAEVWLIDNVVIKADINAWKKLGVDVKTIHTFVFDEDDSSPIGNGLPNVIRDTQMSVCSAVRMALDNASVVCGPNVEVNTALLRPGQDITGVYAYKVWEREDDGITAQFPAVREIEFNSHIPELSQLVEMFMKFGDMETFIGPATGGDAEQLPSEPMRTAAGASMLYGNAALPFKDIIRNFDFFTQSVILSLVYFNRKFNPQLVQEADFDVVARGATSLIAKEVRGIQTDMLAQTLTPEDRDWIDEEDFIRQRLAARDMTGIMVTKTEAMMARSQRQQQAAQMADLQAQDLQAQTREKSANAYKNISQGQKNLAARDKTTTDSALSVLDTGMEHAGQQGTPGQNSQAA